VSFEGVAEVRLKPVSEELSEAIGKPLDENWLKGGLRQLYGTGLYDSVEAAGKREGDGVALTFRGEPRMFIGTVSVDGAKGATMNTQLARATQLNTGTRFTQAKLDKAIEQMRDILADNGFREPTIQHTISPRPEDQVVNLAFRVDSGPQSRVGEVALNGDAGMTVEQFRHAAHLRNNETVNRDTVNRALNGVLKHYQKQERLEGDVKLENQKYETAVKKTNYQFNANRGPVVRVFVEGASLSQDRIRRLIPIYEEGSVDEDLLNEGNRRLRDYFQRQGYFEVKVTHAEQSRSGSELDIRFIVDLGQRRRVERVEVTGNHYFAEETLKDFLSVHSVNTLDRHGVYSQALVAADIAALENVYRNNGFANVKVTPETNAPDTDPKTGTGSDPPAQTPNKGTAPLLVTYHVDEGAQMRVGSLKIEGNTRIGTDMLTPLMNTTPGQLLSPQNLAGDRDALLTMYLARGFNQVAVDVTQHPDDEKPNTEDVGFNIHEGEQMFVRNVLLTGVENTRHKTIANAITVHPGDPLSQSAIEDTQRNLYEFALFSEVNTAVQNPDGDEPYKTVMLHLVEARRWTLTYGFGFEVQTGQPQNNCAGAIAGGVACDPNGKTGVSPRGIFDVTRNNLFGREQSASLQLTYGLLEQRFGLVYQVPRFMGSRNISFSFSGGYANSQDVTTYVASRLDESTRWTQHFSSVLSKANTFVYEQDFRRVKVAASSLQVNPGAIKLLSTAVRVAGPSFTWIRDTRDSPVDSHRGTYMTFQEFVSAAPFGAEAYFNRIDTSNSSYHGFSKDRFVLARNTRYGQMRTFGSGFAGQLPLPERMYAGGATSLRGFGQNAAGPRDPETGFPIGGAGALINSTELRLPPPTLPWFGNSLSFVLFEDMGNIFTNAGDAWISALRIHQPDRNECKKIADPNDPNSFIPNGPTNSTGTLGTCNFNYFTHTPGLGVRYHTPVGPIRLDFSYNLNPPIFPVNIDYSIGTSPENPNGPYSNPHVGQAPHFNFFFSLGQTF
jgi:outer membrane protein assembly complex protein YaeT